MSDSFRRAALDASDVEVANLTKQVKAALEGDSNDADHDALAAVAEFFGIDYDVEAQADG